MDGYYVKAVKKKKSKTDVNIKKCFNILERIISKKGYLTTVRTTNLSNESFETLKIIENCANCKYNPYITIFRVFRFSWLSRNKGHLQSDLSFFAKEDKS